MSFNVNYDSYSIAKVTPLPALPPPTIIDDTENENKPFFCEKTIGGILEGSKYVWKANGSQFRLFDSGGGIKIASWNFAVANLTQESRVTCVAEFKRCKNKLPFLIIGLENGSRGQICIFDLVGSRVLKTIDLDYMVTCISVIDRSGHISLLTEALDAFDGIVAVGTVKGNVYLLDLCQSEYEEALQNVAYVTDEVNISEVEILYPLEIHSVDVDSYRCSTNNRHLLLHLNAVTDNVEHFVLKGPKGVNRLFAAKEEVQVSALHYCSQLGSLLVGYNFGAWQLWDFANLGLVYTSSVHEENIPVSHFAVQEPCDDPRAFCYMWAVYSHTEPYQHATPVAVLYALNYESKSVHSKYGVLYKNLQSCTVRFQITPTTDNENGMNPTQIAANCIRLQVVNKTISKHSLNGQDEIITVCFIIWNISGGRKPEECKTYLNLFDLNQWYKEHMPNSSHSNNAEPFTSRICLTNILTKSNNHHSPLLDVRIGEEGLHQFLGSQKLEEHYYPSSLAFQITSLSDDAVTVVNNKGSQQAMITRLESLGPSVLLNPTDTFAVVAGMGLTPLFVETPTKNAPLDDQREFLLSAALEQQMLSWLCKCVTAWSSGICDTDGCNLNFLLKWAWHRAQVLKENADRLAVSLFDYSGVVLDGNSQQLVNHCLKQIRNLSALFKFVIDKYLGFVLDPDEILSQFECLEVAYIYLEVLHWFQNVGLLPECALSNYPKVDEFDRIYAPYPVDDLVKYYSKRRTELNSCSMKKFGAKESLLFIDNLIEKECGAHHLQKQWEDDGGSGIYPPLSLQALMRSYLVENIKIKFKHHVVTYFLLDLVLTLQDKRYQSTIAHLIKFPSVFHLSPSSIKIIQSFWQIDHGNFEEGIRQLLDPIISSTDLKEWHHRLVLKTLLAQEQYNFALFYLQARRPAVTDLNDLCTIISLYIANNMVDEAFHFQRRHHHTDVSLKLLQHFFKECDKSGNIESILFLPLWPEEEEAFMKYLTDVNHSQRSYIQILYYTQRSRYVEAMKVNDSTNLVQFQNKGLQGKQLITDQDRIMNHLECISNPLSKTILDECKKFDVNTKRGTACTPLSVFVHNSEERIKYKSSLIEAALIKSREIWSIPTVNKKAIKNNDDIPFLCKLKAVLSPPKILSPMIYPRLKDSREESAEPPLKRFKPSSRLCMPLQDTSRRRSRATSTRLSTPIVKRKIASSAVSATQARQSILKSHNFALENSLEVLEKTDDSLADNASKDLPSVRQSSGLGLTPRRPLTKSSKPEVRFTLTRCPSDSSEVSEQDGTVVEEKVMVHAALDGSVEHTISPPVSKRVTNSDSRKRTYHEITNEEIISLSDLPKTPRSRKSYKEHVTERIRSSPRLNPVTELFKNVTTDLKEESYVESDVNEPEQNLVVTTTRTLRSRRSYQEFTKPSQSSTNLRKTKSKTHETKSSLCRDVLENNAFNKMVALSTPTIEQDISTLPSEENQNIVSTTENHANESYQCEQMDVSEIIESDPVVASEVEVPTNNQDNDAESGLNVEIKPDVVSADVEIGASGEEAGKQVPEVSSSVEVGPLTEENFNLYDDLQDDIYGLADPDMYPCDVPIELNEEVCLSSIAQQESDADVLNLSAGEHSLCSSKVDEEERYSDLDPTGLKSDSEHDSAHPSTSNDGEVIELSSDSGERDLDSPSESELNSSLNADSYSSRSRSSEELSTTSEADSSKSETDVSSADSSLEKLVHSSEAITEINLLDVSEENTVTKSALNDNDENVEREESNKNADATVPKSDSVVDSNEEIATASRRDTLSDDPGVQPVNQELNESDIFNTPSQNANVNQDASSVACGSNADIFNETVESVKYDIIDESSFLKTPPDCTPSDNRARSSDTNKDEVTKNSSISYDGLLSLQTEQQSTPVTRSKRSLQRMDTPDVKDMRKFSLKRNMSTSEPNISGELVPANTSIGDSRQTIPASRKRSASVDILTDAEAFEGIASHSTPTKDEAVPARRKRSASSSTTAQSHDTIISSSKSTAIPARRKRSLSANDTTLESSSFQRNLRSRSVDIEGAPQKLETTSSAKSSNKTTESRRRKKTPPTSSLPKIDEDYTSSRRLTRRQAKMLEKAIGDHVTTPVTELSTDTMHSDESLPSNVSDDAIGYRLRSRSVLSDSSVVHSEADNSINVTMEGNKSSTLQTESQPRRLRKTRLNSKDSDTSTISEAHSEIAIKKPAAITRRTRSTTDEIERPSLRRSKRNLQKSTLPQILEEPNADGNAKTKKQKKNL
uniref:Protein ELYS n=1 Tax=Photinus pyralis TaxID=7054 RepID=A0A1Y1N0M4_PHOPY